MVVIRLSRGGAKKSPFYHIVAVDHRNRRDGHFIERLGYFNPVARGNAPRLNLDTDTIEAWIEKGAQISDRVAALVKEAKNPQRFDKIIEDRKKKQAKKATLNVQATTDEANEATEAATTQTDGDANTDNA